MTIQNTHQNTPLVREHLIRNQNLRSALQEQLDRNFPKQRRIASFSRRQSPYSTSFLLDEIDVQFDDGTTLELMFKDLNWYSMLKSAQQVKPFFLYDPIREIETYRRILSTRGFGTAKCYASVVDPEEGHYWLFMERVKGLQLRHVGEFEVWLEAARWLAQLHSRYASDSALARRAHRAHLLSYDRTLFRQWILRAEVLLHNQEATHSPSARRDIRWLASRYHKLVEALVSLPVTLIHGEFYASNIVVRQSSNGHAPRLCPVDWEMAALGPGPIDLAALCAGSWSDEQKVELAAAYYKAWNGAPLGSFKSLLTSLDRCYLHLAIQWLGWSIEWKPPTDQIQDWLEIALALARKLKL